MKELRDTGSDKRVKRLTVRFTPKELEIVEEAAKAANQELAAYVRQESVQAAQSFINWIDASNQSHRRFLAMASKV